MEIKALNKAGDWQGKLLSRGKSNHHSAYFTLRDTLLASCHHPLITVLIKIETCFSNFFCGMNESNIIELMRLNVLSL